MLCPTCSARRAWDEPVRACADCHQTKPNGSNTMMHHEEPEDSTDPAIESARAYGHQAGRTHLISAIERRVQKIVNERGELTPQQAQRLAKVLTSAINALSDSGPRS